MIGGFKQLKAAVHECQQAGDAVHVVFLLL
jgi:hypothetical protein